MSDEIATLTVDQLPVEIHPDDTSLGIAAAQRAIIILQEALRTQDHANMILATGNSQLSFFAALGGLPGVDWSRVQIFHMDEYVGMPSDHPASFRRFLREKIVDRLQPAAFYGIQGDAADPLQECRRYAELLAENPADLCCCGIGENGHLAFNDPPFADFEDPQRVKIVTLDEASRRQQVGEGHFPTLDDVPTQAITLTIPALLAAQKVLAIVPEKRKAQAVQTALQGPISTQCPASILRTAGHARLFLDAGSASLL